MLVHVVDMGAPNPERDFGIIRDELTARDPKLLEKTTLVVANKLDLPGATDALKAFRRRRARRTAWRSWAPPRPSRRGSRSSSTTLARLLPDAETLASPGEPAGVVVHRVTAIDDSFTIEREADGSYRVHGKRIERLAAQTDFEREESAERFQRELSRSGLEKELTKAGVGDGDIVHFGEVELEWGDEWG